MARRQSWMDAEDPPDRTAGGSRRRPLALWRAGRRRDEGARRRWVIVAAVAVVAGLCALFTGGIVVDSRQDFNGQRGVTLHPDLDADLWLAPRQDCLSIPFVFHRCTTRLPCSIRLQLWDHKRRFTSVHVREVVVAYKGAPATTYGLNWTGRLQPHTQVNVSAGRTVRTPMLMLSEMLPVSLERHGEVRVTLTGHLRTTDGEVLPFTTTTTFQPDRSRRWMTFWQYAAGC